MAQWDFFVHLYQSGLATMGWPRCSFFSLAISLVEPQINASAAAMLTITPLTWNVIGLDSNAASVGPNDFPVGARVCNTGTTAASKYDMSALQHENYPWVTLLTCKGYNAADNTYASRVAVRAVLISMEGEPASRASVR
jgi:hypothetical protein